MIYDQAGWPLRVGDVVSCEPGNPEAIGTVVAIEDPEPGRSVSVRFTNGDVIPWVLHRKAPSMYGGDERWTAEDLRFCARAAGGDEP